MLFRSPRDVTEAERWYRAAAKLGSARAEFNLALLILRGEGMKRDVNAAITLLTVAADQGHIGAMRELGLLYDEGRVVPNAPDKAGALLLAAAEGGSRLARDDLTERGNLLRAGTLKEVQRRLIDTGTYKGAASGRLDPATREAIVAKFAASQGRGQLKPVAPSAQTERPAGKAPGFLSRLGGARRAETDRPADTSPRVSAR